MKNSFHKLLVGARVSGDDTHHDRYMPKVVNLNGDHPVLLVCEHAKAKIPEQFQMLGLKQEHQESHIAWDPGAFTTAEFLSRNLNAPLVHASVSRLLYDCNRPPDAEDAMPARSENIDIPGHG